MKASDILAMVGGLALFLYGMSTMGTALEKCAGNRLKTILTRLTSSKITGFFLGMVVTMVVQSSSTTTVMVVGFVNSGLMTLGQSIYIIMGANVGTAVTSWILSLTGISSNVWYISILKPAYFTPIIALIGIVIFMMSKRKRYKDFASILLGFAMLMFGMEMMSGAVEPLADMPSFTSILTMFSNPIMGLLVGTIFTAIIQSSAASIGILQALSLTGTITYATAIPIIIGQNIGTCITAMLSSVGTTKDARRASMVHLYFNIIGAVVWLPLFYLANTFMKLPIDTVHVTPVNIAFVHTVFKVLCVMLMCPFGGALEKLARLTIPDGPDKEDIPMLDERLFVTPSVALERAHAVILDMAQASFDVLKEAMLQLDHYDPKRAEHIIDEETRIDKYEDKIGTYLVKLSGKSLSEANSNEMTKYLHMIGDLERVSDHSVNISESGQEIAEKQIQLLPGTLAELNTLRTAVVQIMDYTMEALRTQDLYTASTVEPLEQVIDSLNKTVRARHLNRLAHAETTIEIGFVLSDILSNLERVADHCSNLAVCVIEIARSSFDSHEYLGEVKRSQDQFQTQYEEFKERFSIDDIEFENN